MITLDEIAAELQRLIREPWGDLSRAERRRLEIYLVVFTRTVRQMMEAEIKELPEPGEPPRNP
jgi:hypothetical protein